MDGLTACSSLSSLIPNTHACSFEANVLPEHRTVRYSHRFLEACMHQTNLNHHGNIWHLEISILHSEFQLLDLFVTIKKERNN